MDLKEVRSLLALSELGSIALAAEQLHLSAPAIHKQLKTLEAELGVPLYEKIGRSLQLTQAAEVLIPYLQDMLAQHDSALAALDEWKAMKRGLVRIGTGPSSYVIPNILKKLRRSHPGIEVLIETGNTPVLLDHLRHGSIDFASIVSPDLAEGRDFSVVATWDFELVLVSHTRQTVGRPHLADLRKHRFILFRKGSRMEEAIDRYFALHGFQPKVGMRIDNPESIKAMVSSGLGLALLPVWVVHKEVKEGRLCIIRQAEAPLYSKIALIQRRARFIPGPLQAFVSVAQNMDKKDLKLLTSV